MTITGKLISVALAGAALLTAPAVSADAAERQAIALATGGVGGVYHPVGQILARLWSREIGTVAVSAEPSHASVANMLMIQAGVTDLAMVQNDIARYSYHAEEMFARQPAAGSSRGVAVLYPEPVQIVASAVWGIRGVDDLAGKRVAVGTIGSGTEVNARQILEAHGLDYNDIAEYFLPIEEAAVALRDRMIHAAFVTAGVPTGAVSDLERKYEHEISLVPIEPEVIEKLTRRWPQYRRTSIPAGTYAGLEADVETVSVAAMLVAREALDPMVVKRLLEVLFREETLARLCAVHRSTCAISRETAAQGMPIPLHAGAREFLEDPVGMVAR